MNPTRTTAIHTNGSVSRANGANRDMIRSAASQLAARRTRMSNGLRRDTNTPRASHTGSARGTTTVLTADASVARTTAAPETKANTRATATTERASLPTSVKLARDRGSKPTANAPEHRHRTTTTTMTQPIQNGISIASR